jgi:hypothetical protein
MSDRSRLLIFLFLILASVFVALVHLWAALVEGGFRAIPLSVVSIFVLIHLPATAAGIWLWRQGALGRMRYLVHGLTLYFCVALFFAMAGTFIWASLVNGLYGGGS